MKTLFLLLILLLTVSPVFAQTDEEEDGLPSVKLITGKYISTTEKFSILLPAEPDQQQEMDSETMGEPGTGAMFSWRISEGALTAAHFNYERKSFKTSADRKRFYAGYIEGYLLDYGGRVLSVREITMSGFPAREVVFINDSDTKGLLRMLAKDSDIYVLTALMSYDTPDYFTAARRVFDTFKYLNAPAAKPAVKSKKKKGR